LYGYFFILAQAEELKNMSFLMRKINPGRGRKRLALRRKYCYNYGSLSEFRYNYAQEQLFNKITLILNKIRE
jgi:hypothetical protein